MRRIVAVFVSGTLLAPLAGAETKQEKVNGYAEWRQGADLIVDGQRVRLAPGGKLKGKASAGGFQSIPLGAELEGKGSRLHDGVFLATELEARPNGSALFEKEVRQATDTAEAGYRQAGNFYQQNASGGIQNIGQLEDSGPRVERVRFIIDTLVPPYLRADELRVYVIRNREWNAFAMGNYSIYVFSGLLDDMDDDEVAIVLGHELVHATHEHTRRQFKKQMWIQLLALGVVASAESIDDRKTRAVVDLLAQFGAMAWSNGYGRDLEDQADRVGMRYAYEAGYDISRGPHLWERFARKYGESGKAANFFLGDHSLASARATNLRSQIALNYPGGPKPEGRAASRAPRRREERRDVAPRPQEPASRAEVGGSMGLAGGTPGTTREIKVGMTGDQVRDILGKPDDEVVFANRTRWTYPDVTVVFENGKVKEVKF